MRIVEVHWRRGRDHKPVDREIQKNGLRHDVDLQAVGSRLDNARSVGHGDVDVDRVRAGDDPKRVTR